MDLIITYNDESHHITINDTTIIDSYIQQEDKGVFIKQLIKTGYVVSSHIIPIKTKCGCCDKIDELTTSMEPFNTGGNSTKNGQIGEIFASDQFTKRNTHITYQDTAKIKKSGDAILTINNHSIDKIMIDYKNYDTPTPSDETDKFVRDLEAQNIHYGILISYKSRISKRQYIDYCISKGKLIVFVAAYGFNILALEMAIQYIQKLHECNTLSISDKMSDIVSNGIIKEYTDIYHKLYELTCQLSQNMNSMKENQEKITKMFYGMMGDSLKLSASMNLLLDKASTIKNDIHREQLSNIHSYTELTDYIHSYIDKGNNKGYAIRILNLAKQLLINGFYSDQDHCIHFEPHGKLQLTKSKLTMIFYIIEDDCRYNRRYETIKNDNYYICLMDEPIIWDIIERRFKNNIPN
jgi:hypothetical protein|tara:strand:- start:68 stop:1291 length:1224 start_codon:yes stop_codon:yes gene_type:complete